MDRKRKINADAAHTERGRFKFIKAHWDDDDDMVDAVKDTNKRMEEMTLASKELSEKLQAARDPSSD